MQGFREEGSGGIITIHLADRSAFFRQGVSAAFLQYPDIKIIGESSVDEETVERLQALSPDVALVDIIPPRYDGIQLTRELSQKGSHTAIALLTPHLDDDELFLATTAGASAYCSKYVEAAELVNTIRRMADGAIPLVDNLIARPHLLGRVIANFRERSSTTISSDSDRVPITERELEILSYAARGFGNKQIAHTLKISEQTIKNHMTSILRKLDANDRTQAVVMAMQSGWISMANSGEKEVPHAN